MSLVQDVTLNLQCIASKLLVRTKKIEMLHSINPATGEVLATYAEQPPEEISRLAEKAATAQRIWRPR
jgi:acyl-CoA reductase-like NAD-dependent aldehyde dehydrogenase